MAQNGTIVRDNELGVMNKISKALDGLEPNVRKRVIQWLNDREQQSTPTTSDSSTAPVATRNSSAKEPS